MSHLEKMQTLLKGKFTGKTFLKGWTKSELGNEKGRVSLTRKKSKRGKGPGSPRGWVRKHHNRKGRGSGIDPQHGRNGRGN